MILLKVREKHTHTLSLFLFLSKIREVIKLWMRGNALTIKLKSYNYCITVKTTKFEVLYETYLKVKQKIDLNTKISLKLENKIMSKS
jgi:hypothetical protein